MTVTAAAPPTSLLERFASTHPDLEVWWDSSPLVYESWRSRMLEATSGDRREALAKELLRLWDPERPTDTLFRGVTTNPPLSLAAMRDDPNRWAASIAMYQGDHPSAGPEEIFWELYKVIVRLGAEALRPLFEASSRRYGHISAQVDPRNPFDSDRMLKQALELAALGPNVMIKIPGTAEGLPVLRELTRRGVSTNCTSGFILAQFIAVAEHVQAGLLEARAEGVNLSGWKSVVTDMSARWENAGEFVAEGRAVGVELSPEDRRWAGIAIFKHAHQVFRQRAYPSKMLICSVRVGPTVDGVEHCWHLEHLAGADAVFTLPPAFLTEFLQRCDGMEFASRIEEPIPADVMARLRRVPYFNQGYDLDGATIDQFDTLPALLSTYREFSQATEDMVQFVRDHMNRQK